MKMRTEMPIDVNLWWWIWNAHRCLISSGEYKMPIDVWSLVVKTEIKENALNKAMEIRDALIKLKEWGCPKQTDENGMP